MFNKTVKHLKKFDKMRFFNAGLNDPTDRGSFVGNIDDFTIVLALTTTAEGLGGDVIEQIFVVEKKPYGFALFPINEESKDFMFRHHEKRFLYVPELTASSEPLSVELSDEDKDFIDKLGAASQEEEDADRQEILCHGAFVIPYDFFKRPQDDFLFTNAKFYLFEMSPASFFNSFGCFIEHYKDDVLNLRMNENHEEYNYFTNLFKIAISGVANFSGIKIDTFLYDLDFNDCSFTIKSRAPRPLFAAIIKRISMACGVHIDDMSVQAKDADDVESSVYRVNFFKENFILLDEIDTLAVTKSLSDGDDGFDFDDDEDTWETI